MDNGNRKKFEQLGMPFGTASGRLKKIIMLHLLCRLNENKCYRCGQSIDKVEELSVEHKTPWLDNDPSLFWDLDNIAFSHLVCNISVARKSSMPVCAGWGKKNPPAGMAWCGRCKDFLSQSLFDKTHRSLNGLDWECKSCKSARRRRIPPQPIFQSPS